MSMPTTRRATCCGALHRRGALNSPWGLALAPADFGAFGNMLLVGNFGDGRINAYDLGVATRTGEAAGRRSAAQRQGPRRQIDGLWALQFGNGAGAGPKNTLFFTSGPFGAKRARPVRLAGAHRPAGPQQVTRARIAHAGAVASADEQRLAREDLQRTALELRCARRHRRSVRRAPCKVVARSRAVKQRQQLSPERILVAQRLVIEARDHVALAIDPARRGEAPRAAPPAAASDAGRCAAQIHPPGRAYSSATCCSVDIGASVRARSARLCVTPSAELRHGNGARPARRAAIVSSGSGRAPHSCVRQLVACVAAYASDGSACKLEHARGLRARIASAHRHGTAATRESAGSGRSRGIARAPADRAGRARA